MKNYRVTYRAALLLATCVSWSTLAFGFEDLGKFNSLIRQGQAIYLRSSQNSPYFSVQILTEKQATEVRQTVETAANHRKRLGEIKAKLETEKSLESRIALFLEHEELQSNVARTQQRSRTTLYEVQWVAADYIAVKRDGIEKYVPFRSIISIEKRDALPIAARTTIRSLRPPRGLPTTTRHRIRLKNLEASKIVDLVKKTFPNDKIEIKAETANSLTLTGMSVLVQRVDSLVRWLDVETKE